MRSMLSRRQLQAFVRRGRGTTDLPIRILAVFAVELLRATILDYEVLSDKRSSIASANVAGDKINNTLLKGLRSYNCLYSCGYNAIDDWLGGVMVFITQHPHRIWTFLSCFI